MNEQLYPRPSPELSRLRRDLAPGPAQAFHAFSEAVFTDGALSAKFKNIIAVAVAHVTQCPYCVVAHTRTALRRGASRQELMEAIWVAAEMRAGAAFAHSVIALAQMEEHGPDAREHADRHAGTGAAVHV